MGDYPGIESYPTKSLDLEQGTNTILPRGNGRFNQTTTFGDVSLVVLLSPAHSDLWLLGPETTFIFPTDVFGGHRAGKWQAGPAVVGCYPSKKLLLAAIPPHPSRI